MVYKFLFYFISWFNKRIDLHGGTDEYCFYAASALVGMTIAVSLYAVINIACIVFFRSSSVYSIVSNVMDVLCFVLSFLSFLYFRRNGRWDIIYGETQQTSSSQKSRYGIYCILYVLSAYGLWFFSNGIIRVLNTGDGSSMAIIIVEILNLTHW